MAAGGGGSCDPLAPAGVPCAFSPDSQAYFALASPDGHLRVWETANNRLHQEYVPSAHLSGTCTCLAWAPARLQAKVVRAGPRWGRVLAPIGVWRLRQGDLRLRISRSPSCFGAGRLGAPRRRALGSPRRLCTACREGNERERFDPAGSVRSASHCRWAAIFAKVPDPPGVASFSQAPLTRMRSSEPCLLTEPHLGTILLFPTANSKDWLFLDSCNEQVCFHVSGTPSFWGAGSTRVLSRVWLTGLLRHSLHSFLFILSLSFLSLTYARLPLFSPSLILNSSLAFGVNYSA